MNGPFWRRPFRLVPNRVSYLLPGGEETTLIGPDVTGCFGLARVCAAGPCPRENPSFRVLLVEKGKGELSGGGVTLPLKQGTEVFVPAGVEEYLLTPKEEELAVLERIPPPLKHRTAGRKAALYTSTAGALPAKTKEMR